MQTPSTTLETIGWCDTLDRDTPALTPAAELPWSAEHFGPSVPDLVMLLEAKGAGELGHAVTTFTDHLFQSFSIVQRWRQPHARCMAALFHSAYGSDANDVPLFRLEDRGDLRTWIGAEAERLVLLFCTVDRVRLRTSVETGIAADGVVGRNWRTAEERRLTPHEVAALLVIEAANLAEQCHDGELGPGLWVASCGRLAGRIDEIEGGMLPPFLAGCPTVTDEERARDLYLDACRRIDDAPDDAVAMLLRASELNPCVGEPAAVGAALAQRAGDRPRARTLAIAAVERLERWGTPWDKRADLGQWLAFARSFT